MGKADEINIKKSELEIEVYDVAFNLSEEGKKRLIDNPTEFMKEQLEAKGFKVNRVMVNKDAILKNIQENIDPQESMPYCFYVHIVSPPEIESYWQQVCISSPVPTKPR